MLARLEAETARERVRAAPASPVVTASASPVMRPCACVSHGLYCLGGRVVWLLARTHGSWLCYPHKIYRKYDARTSFSL